MAWVPVEDDGNAATPQTYTDLDGHSTTMSVTSTNGVFYIGDSYWAIGDNSSTAAEAHTHTFSTPINKLRIDVSFLDNGDFAQFSYVDTNGNAHKINLTQWMANGDAIVTLGAGHTIQPLPRDPSLIGIRGSTPSEAATSVVELTFPTPAKQFILGKNNVQGPGLVRDAYGYKLFYDDHLSVVCFAGGTQIETENGPVAIEKLRAGDMIKTSDSDFQPLRWVGSHKLRAYELKAYPNLRPIRIDAGALGTGVPANDLVVSPQHRILIRSAIAYEMFNSDEILVAAKHLLELPGVNVAEDMDEVEYFHVLFDRHEVIFADGAEAESLYTGSEAMKALSPAVPLKRSLRSSLN